MKHKKRKKKLRHTKKTRESAEISIVHFFQQLKLESFTVSSHSQDISSESFDFFLCWSKSRKNWKYEKKIASIEKCQQQSIMHEMQCNSSKSKVKVAAAPSLEWNGIDRNTWKNRELYRTNEEICRAAHWGNWKSRALDLHTHSMQMKNAELQTTIRCGRKEWDNLWEYHHHQIGTKQSRKLN